MLMRLLENFDDGESSKELRMFLESCRSHADDFTKEDCRSFIDGLLPKHSFGVISLCEGDAGNLSCLAANGQEWEDILFEVALDSGCTDHVCAEIDTPGYRLSDSPGSKRGQCFIIGDGNRLPNTGQKALRLETEGAEPSVIESTFQIAKVARPLMSVGKICDAGMRVVFSDAVAIVEDSNKQEVCRFERDNGGLYVAKLRLKRPDHFGRPA